MTFSFKSTHVIAIFAILVLVIGAFIAYFTFSKKPSQATTAGSSETIKLGYLANANSLPFFTAAQKGYFKDAGLNVELVEFPASTQLVDAIYRGDVVGGCCGAIFSALNAQITSPGKLKIWFASDESKSPDWNGIILKDGLQISSVKEFEGKKMGMVAGPTTQIFQAYLKAQGVDISKVNFVAVDPKDQLTSLSAGTVDAIYAFEPNLTLSESKKIGKIYERGQINQLYQNPSISTGYITNDIKISNEKQVSLNKAINKAIVYNKTNPEQALKESASYLKFDPELASKIKKIEYFEIGSEPVQEIQKFADFLAQISVIKQKVQIDQILYKETR
jgi:NitT/TauT family transport system substrate-binding protein